MCLCAGEAPDSKQRRLNMIKAVEGDDWSAVINSQTQQTIEGASGTIDLAVATSNVLSVWNGNAVMLILTGF